MCGVLEEVFGSDAHILYLERQRSHVVDQSPFDKLVNGNVVGGGVILGLAEDVCDDLQATEMHAGRALIEAERHLGSEN